MKKVKECFLLFVIAFIFIQSCKKKDDDDTNNSRLIKYEVSGTYSGGVIASYISANGGTINETVTLPWSKEVNYNSNVSAAVMAVSGNGGTAGQQVKVVVLKGGTQISSTTVTADNTGSFSSSVPVITF